MHKIRSERIRGSRVSSQQDPWIQIGSGPHDPDPGQSTSQASRKLAVTARKLVVLFGCRLVATPRSAIGQYQ
eukprot:scaffold47163_cov91-Phaeocystis_antarctica.AAC.3